jgi:hypothetical protein
MENNQGWRKVDNRIITEEQYQSELRSAEMHDYASSLAERGWFISVPAGLIAWGLIFFSMSGTTGWFWRGLLATIGGAFVFYWINYILMLGAVFVGIYLVCKALSYLGAFDLS